MRNAPRRTNQALQPQTGTVVPFRPEPGSQHRAATPALAFSWDMLERQLGDLAVSPSQKALVSTLVSATRKQAPFKPAELVLREVLCIASVLMDETFHPGSEEGEMT